TKDVGKGSGLGLFIVHEIIEEHDGCIAVDSEAGKGTTFFISLPAKE
ncbi:MAG: ATP-binding protein, partial [Nitrospirota bacterium]